MPLVRCGGVREITFRLSLSSSGQGFSQDFDGLLSCAGNGQFTFTDTDDLKITNATVISSGGQGGVTISHDVNTGVWTFRCSSSRNNEWHVANSNAYGVVEITFEIG